jgi:hypothetical protein
VGGVQLLGTLENTPSLSLKGQGLLLFSAPVISLTHLFVDDDVVVMVVIGE